MRDNTDKTFILVGLIALMLLLLHQLPPFAIGDVELRRVSILGDISDSPFDKEQHDVIPKPLEPARQLRLDRKNGKKAVFKEVWPEGVQRIVDFSGGENGGMDHFYSMLDSLARGKKAGRPVRVAYYGDSFIEGDILVSDFRELMQDKYGGYGVGWIDAGNSLNQYKHTIDNRFSGMTEHMVMKRESYSCDRTGIAERYYPVGSEAMMYFHSKAEYPHVSKWDVARLYYTAPSGLSVSVKVDGGMSVTKRLGSIYGVGMMETRQVMNNISYAFSCDGATLFGVALESDEGIIVDNFSMRGSSGVSLSNIPEKTLCGFNVVRPYDLIIFQFGVNAITSASKDAAMQAYTGKMKRVIQHYRKCFPEASILVISTPDRGARSAGGIGTMKGVEMLVDYQERLASECRVGFYNLFEAMGGEGAMGKLMEQGMGAKDLVHISHKGGKLLSKHLFDSFVAGQKNWTDRQKAIKGSNG